MSKRWLVSQAEHYDQQAKEHGLATSQELQIGPLRYRWDLIERDVNALLWRRRGLPEGSPGTYPESLVSYSASMYLGCCMAEGRAPSQELLLLIGGLLKASNFGPRGKDYQLLEARRIRGDQPGMSNGELGRHVGVDVATVGRWVKSGKL